MRVFRYVHVPVAPTKQKSRVTNFFNDTQSLLQQQQHVIAVAARNEHYYQGSRPARHYVEVARYHQSIDSERMTGVFFDQRVAGL